MRIDAWAPGFVPPWSVYDARTGLPVPRVVWADDSIDSIAVCPCGARSGEERGPVYLQRTRSECSASGSCTPVVVRCPLVVILTERKTILINVDRETILSEIDDAIAEGVRSVVEEVL